MVFNQRRYFKREGGFSLDERARKPALVKGGEGGDETNPCNAHTAALIETIGETKAHQNCRSTSSSGGDNAAITK